MRTGCVRTSSLTWPMGPSRASLVTQYIPYQHTHPLSTHAHIINSTNTTMTIRTFSHLIVNIQSSFLLSHYRMIDFMCCLLLVTNDKSMHVYVYIICIPVGVCLCFAIIISYVMILAPARENLEEFFLRRTGWESAAAVTTSRHGMCLMTSLPSSTTVYIINYLSLPINQTTKASDSNQLFQ